MRRGTDTQPVYGKDGDVVPGPLAELLGRGTAQAPGLGAAQAPAQLRAPPAEEGMPMLLPPPGMDLQASGIDPILVARSIFRTRSSVLEFLAAACPLALVEHRTSLWNMPQEAACTSRPRQQHLQRLAKLSSSVLVLAAYPGQER